MPSFTGTMRKGLEGLKKSDAATKHMIIISDGDPALPRRRDLVQEYIDNKISVSTVAIYPHGGNEIGLMRNVSTATGGRYCFYIRRQPAPLDLRQGVENPQAEHDSE